MPSPEPGSYALIVGADTYADKALGQLRSPTHDGRELSDVLSDPRIGGFSTRQLFNRPAYEVAEEIEGFFADRRPDDLLVMHLSCHGVKDESGRLYFAMSSTRLDRLAATGLSAAFVNEQIDRSRSHKIVLLLDCCYSGAFPQNLTPRSSDRMGLDRFQGRGRVVISASTALEYAYESDTRLLSGAGRPSVFTGVLVEGLRTGKADVDNDGIVSVDELYDYLFDHVRQITPHQTPEKISTVRGELIIARNPRWAPNAQPAASVSTDSGQDDAEDESAKGTRPFRLVANTPVPPAAPLSTAPASTRHELTEPKPTAAAPPVLPMPPIRPRKKTSGRRKSVLGIIAVAGAITAVVVGYLLATNLARHDPPAALVPSLSGLAKKAAISQLTRLDVTPILVEENSDTIPAGIVIDTDPASGQLIYTGDSVTLRVSLGPSLSSAPSPSSSRSPSQSPSSSRSPSQSPSSSRPPSSSPRQTPPRTKNTPRPTVEVPSVMGLTLANARDRLLAAGFKVRSTMQSSDVVPQGSVIDQFPQPGAKLETDDTIMLTVSSGPSQEPPTDLPTDQPQGDNPFGN
ncbi:caspase, EACC1-associated type [Microbispora hainanensis]|uniref:PASTA domain-containing protein n=1 Tax=Microbispora hainanensis TaxID=568844 RepID=A0A544Z5D7_9ACTN|nr:PASTA domain-containing protein [Microbispora hainanensis]TQS24265.1 PASTA domain-containing protein [Microbispora hainanensis]